MEADMLQQSSMVLDSLWTERTKPLNECSIVLKVSEDSRRPYVMAHRGVLMSSCSLFAASPELFRTEQIEGRPVQVVLVAELLRADSLDPASPELRERAFMQLLRCIYSQPLELDIGLAQVMMTVADLFGCKSALNAASGFLSRSIEDPAKAIKYFIASRKYRMAPRPLVEKIKQVIADNIRNILKPASTSTMTSLPLYKQMFQLDTDDIKELLSAVHFEDPQIVMLLVSSKVASRDLRDTLLGLDLEVLRLWWDSPGFAAYSGEQEKWLDRNPKRRKGQVHELLRRIRLESFEARSVLQKVSYESALFQNPKCAGQLITSAMKRCSLTTRGRLMEILMQPPSSSNAEVSSEINKQKPFVKGIKGVDDGCHVWKVNIAEKKDRSEQVVGMDMGYQGQNSQLQYMFIGVTEGDCTDSLDSRSFGWFQFQRGLNTYCDGSAKPLMNFPMYKGANYTVPDEFYMVLNLTDGTLGFATLDKTYLGDCCCGIPTGSGQTYFPLVHNSTTKAWLVQLSYIGGLDANGSAI